MSENCRRTIIKFKKFFAWFFAFFGGCPLLILINRKNKSMNLRQVFEDLHYFCSKWKKSWLRSTSPERSTRLHFISFLGSGFKSQLHLQSRASLELAHHQDLYQSTLSHKLHFTSKKFFQFFVAFCPRSFFFHSALSKKLLRCRGIIFSIAPKTKW